MAKKDSTPADDKKPEKKKPRTPKEKAIAAVRWTWPIVVIVLVVFALRSTLVDWNDVPSGSMRPTIIEGDRIFVNKLSYDLKFPFTQWRLARWGHPQRGDIVVWLHPTEGNWMGPTRLVKRVVGLPGDTIELCDYSTDDKTPGLSKLVINGKEMEYEPASAPASVPDQFISYRVQDRTGAWHTGRRAFYTEDLMGVRHLVGSQPTNPTAVKVMFPNGQAGAIENVKRVFGPFTVPPGRYFLMGDNRDESRDCRFFEDIGFSVPEDAILGRSSRVVISLDESWIPRGDRFFHAMP